MFEERADTLAMFVEKVDQFWTKEATYRPDWIWYRGVSKHPEFKLIPSFYRNIVRVENAAVVDDREKILTREFLYKYELYDTNHVGHTSRSEAAVIFGKMQHYGLSSRLLDFSYSALVALYMAVGTWEGWQSGKHIAHPAEDGAVWLLDAALANNVLGHGDSIPNFYQKSEYLPPQFRKDGVSLPRPPIALEAPLSNRRIIAQQGCFVCFGVNPAPLDVQLGPAFPGIGLIRIPSIRKSDIYEQLERVGISDDVLFQDLQTLGNRLHRHYGADSP
jgi:hypothetical protein